MAETSFKPAGKWLGRSPVDYGDAPKNMVGEDVYESVAQPAGARSHAEGEDYIGVVQNRGPFALAVNIDHLHHLMRLPHGELDFIEITPVYGTAQIDLGDLLRNAARYPWIFIGDGASWDPGSLIIITDENGNMIPRTDDGQPSYLGINSLEVRNGVVVDPQHPDPFEDTYLAGFAITGLGHYYVEKATSFPGDNFVLGSWIELSGVTIAGQAKPAVDGFYQVIRIDPTYPNRAWLGPRFTAAQFGRLLPNTPDPAGPLTDLELTAILEAANPLVFPDNFADGGVAVSGTVRVWTRLFYPAFWKDTANPQVEHTLALNLNDNIPLQADLPGTGKLRVVFTSKKDLAQRGTDEAARAFLEGARPRGILQSLITLQSAYRGAGSFRGDLLQDAGNTITIRGAPMTLNGRVDAPDLPNQGNPCATYLRMLSDDGMGGHSNIFVQNALTSPSGSRHLGSALAYVSMVTGASPNVTASGSTITGNQFFDVEDLVPVSDAPSPESLLGSRVALYSAGWELLYFVEVTALDVPGNTCTVRNLDGSAATITNGTYHAIVYDPVAHIGPGSNCGIVTAVEPRSSAWVARSDPDQANGVSGHLLGAFLNPDRFDSNPSGYLQTAAIRCRWHRGAVGLQNFAGLEVRPTVFKLIQHPDQDTTQQILFANNGREISTGAEALPCAEISSSRILIRSSADLAKNYDVRAEVSAEHGGAKAAHATLLAKKAANNLAHFWASTNRAPGFSDAMAEVYSTQAIHLGLGNGTWISAPSYDYQQDSYLWLDKVDLGGGQYQYQIQALAQYLNLVADTSDGPMTLRMYNSGGQTRFKIIADLVEIGNAVFDGTRIDSYAHNVAADCDYDAAVWDQSIVKKASGVVRLKKAAAQSTSINLAAVRIQKIDAHYATYHDVAIGIKDVTGTFNEWPSGGHPTCMIQAIWAYLNPTSPTHGMDDEDDAWDFWIPEEEVESGTADSFSAPRTLVDNGVDFSGLGIQAGDEICLEVDNVDTYLAVLGANPGNHHELFIEAPDGNVTDMGWKIVRRGTILTKSATAFSGLIPPPVDLSNPIVPSASQKSALLLRYLSSDGGSNTLDLRIYTMSTRFDHNRRI